MLAVYFQRDTITVVLFSMFDITVICFVSWSIYSFALKYVIYTTNNIQFESKYDGASS